MLKTTYLNSVSCWHPPHVTTRDKSCKWLADMISQEISGIKGDVALVGVPFDYAVNYRPGTRFGPNSIRESLASQTAYVTDRRMDLSNLSIIDYGNVDIIHDIKETYHIIERVAEEINASLLTVFLGGDHSITRYLINGVLSRSCENLGLISFDAHFDSRVPISGKEHSGHWMLQIQEDQPKQLLPTNIAIIGLSAGSYSPDYQKNMDDKGILTFTVSETRRLGVERIIEQTIEQCSSNTAGIYVTLDIDVLHQAFAPGTSVPNPHGLYPDFIYDALYIIGRSGKLKALDIVEVNPLTDVNGNSSTIAAQAILQALAGIQSFIEAGGAII